MQYATSYLRCDMNPIVNTFPPTIVLGCFHSGTRAIVSILEALGSYSGPIENPWREHEVFLEIHEQLMTSRFGSDIWHRHTLLDDYVDDLRVLPLARNLVNQAVNRIIQNPLWHWKNPRSTYFLKTWEEIYPNALFLHIIRDGRDVAISLCKANGKDKFPTLDTAFRLWEKTVPFILRNLPANTLTIKYEELLNSVDKVATNLSVYNAEKISAAKSLVKVHTGQWKQLDFCPTSMLLSQLNYY